MVQGITVVAETTLATGPNPKYPTTHHQTTGRIKEAYRGPHTNGSHPYDDGDDLPLGHKEGRRHHLATLVIQDPSNLNTAEEEAPKL